MSLQEMDVSEDEELNFNQIQGSDFGNRRF